MIEAIYYMSLVIAAVLVTSLFCLVMMEEGLGSEKFFLKRSGSVITKHRSLEGLLESATRFLQSRTRVEMFVPQERFKLV